MRFDANCTWAFHQSTVWGNCRKCGGTWKTWHLDREPQPPTPPAIVRANVALIDLKAAMDDVRTTFPGHMPGEGPTAADNCQEILKMMDWNIRQVAAYLGLDRAEAQ